MPTSLFILFVLIMLGSALVVVLHRNPVASAMALVCCFISLAALFIGLNAYFLGIIQILVYAGAVMVLFLFIIMLLDINREEEEAIFFKKKNSFIAGCLIAVALIAQIAGVCMSYKPGKERAPKLTLREAAYMRGVEVPVPSANRELFKGRLPDVKLIGEQLFTRYNFHLQIIATLLLVSAIGVVTLSKKYPQRRVTENQNPNNPVNPEGDSTVNGAKEGQL